MGRGKRKRKEKRKLHAKQRRIIKLKMGKRVYFTLMRCPHALAGFSDRYNYKANLYKANYKNARFYNVRWQASSLTYCSFNQAKLIGVDFFNSNLGKTSFKNAYLEDVVFFNCNLKNVNFINAKFKRVIFISTNIDAANNLVIDKECKIYYSYPHLQLPDSIKQQLLDLSKFNEFYECNVLHVNKRKLNLWILQTLIDCYGVDALRALCALNQRRDKCRFYTVHSYMKHIEKYLKL